MNRGIGPQVTLLDTAGIDIGFLHKGPGSSEQRAVDPVAAIVPGWKGKEVRSHDYSD